LPLVPSGILLPHATSSLTHSGDLLLGARPGVGQPARARPGGAHAFDVGAGRAPPWGAAGAGATELLRSAWAWAWAWAELLLEARPGASELAAVHARADLTGGAATGRRSPQLPPRRGEVLLRVRRSSPAGWPGVVARRSFPMQADGGAPAASMVGAAGFGAFVASICSTGLKCFRKILQVLHVDVAKVDLNVAYTLQICCKCLIRMLHFH